MDAGEVIHINVHNCSRCGGTHKQLEARKLTRPCREFTHWGTCPETGEPLMVLIVRAGENRP